MQILKETKTDNFTVLFKHSANVLSGYQNIQWEMKTFHLLSVFGLQPLLTQL